MRETLGEPIQRFKVVHVVVVFVSLDRLLVELSMMQHKIRKTSAVLLEERFSVRVGEVDVDEVGYTLHQLSLEGYYYWSSNFRGSRGAEEDDARICAKAKNCETDDCRKKS